MNKPTKGWMASGIVDDILVYGCTLEEHDTNLCAVLKRTRKHGIKHNLEKSALQVQRASPI